MFVLDCDTEEAYQDVAARGLPVTMTVKTARGYHLYFAYPDGLAIGNRTGLLPGCDIRGDGGYVVAPPSLHPSGIHYKWIHDVAPAAAPGWLLDLLTMKERRAALPKGKGGRAGEEVRDPAAYIAAAFDREINTLINAQEGERNNTLNTAAFNLGQLVPSGMIREFDVFKALEGAALASRQFEERFARLDLDDEVERGGGQWFTYPPRRCYVPPTCGGGVRLAFVEVGFRHLDCLVNQVEGCLVSDELHLSAWEKAGNPIGPQGCRAADDVPPTIGENYPDVDR